LHDLARIRRVVVATYQSVSGAGREAMDELFNQTRSVYVNDPMTKEIFTKQIAFNCIPHIDVFMEDGATKEEWKMAVETRKILDPDIAVHATCVRVPVFIGHAEAVNVEFENPISVEQARAALKAAPGVSVVDHRVDEGYVTPQESAGEDSVFVSRIRRDPTVKHGLSLWVVADKAGVFNAPNFGGPVSLKKEPVGRERCQTTPQVRLKQRRRWRNQPFRRPTRPYPRTRSRPSSPAPNVTRPATTTARSSSTCARSSSIRRSPTPTTTSA
jgi:hypothetical protein